MSELLEALDLYDRAVEAARASLGDEVTERAASIAREARRRRTVSEHFFVAGLLGGTGSGKSSLLNALAGEEVSPPGAIRPTTETAVAWAPRHHPAELAALAQTLGIGRVVEHDRDALTLIDLPDIDSHRWRHRQAVESIMPYLDLVLWVVDPEKYRDRVLHDELLRPLIAHREKFRFVLNQIDRLSGSELTLLVTDLRSALESDGFSSPVIWPVAADPPSGPPIAIEEVAAGLEAALSDGSSRRQQIVIDLRRGASCLASYLEPTGFRESWELVLADAVASILGGDSRPAAMELARLVEEVAPGLDVDVGDAVAAARASSDPAGTLDRMLGRAVRDYLRPRAMARALVTELQIELNDLT